MSAAWPLVAVAALGVAGVAWPLFGYGRAIRALARLRRGDDDPRPGHVARARVTVLLAVFNERSTIEARIRNLLDTDHPADLLRIVVASDGSTDGTDDVARAYPDERVGVVRSEQRAGKSIAQNAGIAAIDGGIVVITDCGTTFDRRTIPELVAPFADPDVGVVDGALRFEPPPGAQAIRAHGTYWNYESLVRSAESRLGILATASGAVMAARREVIREIPGHVGDDCVVPLMAVAAGLRVHRANAACAWDESNSDPRAEFRSRIRMVVRNWQGTWMFPGLLAPWRRPAMALGLWSHKVLRWCAPVFVLLALGALAALGVQEGGAWTWVAVAAWALALLGGADAFATWWTRGRHRASPLGSFALVCTAFGVGLARAVTGHRIGGYRDRTATAACAFIAGSALLVAVTARADGTVLPPGWELVASAPATQANSVVSPCVVAASPDRRVAYCASSGGESFAGGGVWKFGITGGEPLAPRLDVGRNCCALRCIGTDGSTLVAAWRGSGEIVTIDAKAWRIRDVRRLGFVPMDVAVDGDRAWAVGLTDRGEGAVAAFRLDDGMLRPTADRRLAEPAHRAAIVAGALVVTEPVGGFVEWLDATTLERQAQFAAGRSPLAIAAAGAVALVATREGDLLELDGSAGLRRRTDLAGLFAIDPDRRALRDLDPTDVIPLPDGRVIVGAYRVDGFLVELSASGLRPIARVPAAVRHTLVSADGDAVTLLLGRRKGVEAVSIGPAGVLPGKAWWVARGEAVTAWAQMPSPGAVAVVTSAGGPVQVLEASRGRRSSLPMPAGSGQAVCIAAESTGGLLVVASTAASGHQVIAMPQGLGRTPAVLPSARSPSWVGVVAGQWLVLDRLQAVAWLQDDGTQVRLVAPRIRPRAAARLADGAWIVIHDTHPNVGCSRIAGGAWEEFAPLKEGGWPTSIVAAPGGRTAYLVTFNGMLCELGADLRVLRHRDLKLAGASAIAVDATGRMGIASENAGVGLLLESFGAAPVEFRSDGLQSILPQSDGSLALVTQAGAEFLRGSPPAASPGP